MKQLEQVQARQRVLEPLLAARQLLDLVEVAEESGMIELLREGSSVDDVAAAASLEVQTARSVLDALIAGEVVRHDGNEYILTDDWNVATSAGAFTPFSAAIRGRRVASNLLRSLGGPSANDYWTASSADRIALAASMSPDPIEGGAIDMFASQLANGHPFELAVSKANRILELGCGLAGSALSHLVAHPRLHTVGVELSDDLATEAERRAEILGVADRFTVVRCDAADFSDPESFDVGFWSQFFFADHSRAAALRTLHRQVRSGGTVVAPVRWYDEDRGGGPTSTSAKSHALFRVMSQTWGVPDRNPSQVADEFESAGFSVTHVLTPTPTNALVVATRL